MVIETEKQFCINCTRCKVKRNWYFKPVDYLCGKTGNVNVVTGKREGAYSCEQLRRYHVANCPDYLSNKTPLRKVSDKILLDEIRSRNLFEMLKNYKKETE
jgi:hypothetical protein